MPYNHREKCLSPVITQKKEKVQDTPGIKC